MFNSKLYRIKDVSVMVDRDKSTIFRWEKSGKIPSPKRDSRGWRVYTERDVKKIKKVAREMSYF